MRSLSLSSFGASMQLQQWPRLKVCCACKGNKVSTLDEPAFFLTFLDSSIALRHVLHRHCSFVILRFLLIWQYNFEVVARFGRLAKLNLNELCAAAVRRRSSRGVSPIIVPSSGLMHRLSRIGVRIGVAPTRGVAPGPVPFVRSGSSKRIRSKCCLVT
jgi:hypothetical protein